MTWKADFRKQGMFFCFIIDSIAKLNVDHLFKDQLQNISDNHVLMSFEIMSKLREGEIENDLPELAQSELRFCSWASSVE